MSPYKNVYPNICYFRFWESKRSSDFKRNRQMSPALFWFKAPRTVVSSQLCIPNFSIGILQWRSQSCTGQATTAAARPAESQTLLSWPGLPLLSSLLRRSLCSVGVYCCRQACPEPIFAELARLATAAAKLQQQLRPGARKALVCNVDTILKWKFRRSILQYRVMCARGALALQILKNLLHPRRVRHQCRALPNWSGVRPRSDQSGSTLVDSDPKTPR